MISACSNLRVAFDARSLAQPVLRGWDRYTVGLAGELVRQGVEVTLFHRQRAPLNPLHVGHLGCDVVGLPDRGGLFWEQVSVPRALDGGRYDVFHAPAEHGVPLASPCPVVLTIHSVTDRSYRDFIRRGLLPGRLEDYLDGSLGGIGRLYCEGYNWLQRFRASHIITPSAFCREEVICFLGVAPRRVSAIPLATHDQFDRPRGSQRQLRAVQQRYRIRTPYLLYVGGYESHKNVGGLLKTFALLRSRMPELSLVLVGSKGCPPELVTKLRQSNLLDHTVPLVNVTDDLTDLYDGAELFVSLSWRETFCLPALEAITRGVPVVASCWGAIAEVVGNCGRLVDPRDEPAAAEAILEVLNERRTGAYAQRLPERARQFSWAATARKTLDIYRTIL